MHSDNGGDNWHGNWDLVSRFFKMTLIQEISDFSIFTDLAGEKAQADTKS